MGPRARPLSSLLIASSTAAIVSAPRYAAAWVPPPRPVSSSPDATPPEGAEAEARPPAEAMPAPLAVPEPRPARDPLAVGLLVTGGLLIAGGATLIGLGATLEPRAQEAFDNRAPEADEDFWQNYLDTERQRGILFMAMGGVFGAAGIGIMTWGAVRYVRYKREFGRARLSFAPARGGGRVLLQARF